MLTSTITGETASVGDGAPATTDRWFGAGSSTAADSATAGTEAAVTAVAGRAPAAVFVFCSISYDLPALVAAVRATVGRDAIIVGNTTLGEISLAGPTDRGVSVAALGGDGFTFRARLTRFVPGELRKSGVEAAACMAEVDAAYTVLVLLLDAFSGNPHEIVRGAYSVVGATVPLVGGCAGGDMPSGTTYQFFSAGGEVEVLTGAVIGLAIGSNAPLGIGIAHGWRRSGTAMIVTRSSASRIYELDGEPAMDVLLDRLREQGVTTSESDLFKPGVLLRPLGLSRRSGEDIRVIHSGDLADRSLVSLADVPQGALVWLMESDDESLVAGAGQSCSAAVAALDGVRPAGALVFDCGGRYAQLGSHGVRREVDEMRRVLGDVPFAGFYTTGEIARLRGATGMHHLTLVTLALA